VPVARAFAQFLHLANVAEEYHRIRRRRAHQRDPGAGPQPHSLEDTLSRLASTASPARLREAVLGLRIELVVTAHPTEMMRRTLQRKYNAIAAALEGLARFADASRRLDSSLPQMVDSARGKVDYQFARLHEGLAGKVRGRIDREHPAWRRLRYVLLPGDKLQERRLASLEPVARRGAGVIGEICDLAAEHAARTADGVHEHYVVEA